MNKLLNREILDRIWNRLTSYQWFRKQWGGVWYRNPVGDGTWYRISLDMERSIRIHYRHGGKPYHCDVNGRIVLDLEYYGKAEEERLRSHLEPNWTCDEYGVSH